jgi:hypothetical protein
MRQASNTRERNMSKKSGSTDRQSNRAPYGQQRQPQRESEDTEEGGFEKSQDSPIDDPGDAQRSSKTDLDGDGEEEMR